MSSIEQLNSKFRIGTIVKLKQYPIPRNSDDVAVIDYVRAKYGDSPLDYISSYASDRQVYLSHLSTKIGKGHKLKIPIDLLEVIDTSKVQDPLEYKINYNVLTAPLNPGDIIFINDIKSIIIALNSYDSHKGTGKVTVCRYDKALSSDQNSLNEVIILTTENWRRSEEIQYNKNTFNNTVLIKDNFKNFVKDIYKNFNHDSEIELNYIVNSSFSISSNVGDFIYLSDNYYGHNFILPYHAVIDLHTQLTLASQLPIPMERKFSKLKCLKNKGKTQYKLTIGKEYKVIKYQQDELIGAERVIILNDNNVEKSYDPKLFKGIE